MFKKSLQTVKDSIAEPAHRAVAFSLLALLFAFVAILMAVKHAG